MSTAQSTIYFRPARSFTWHWVQGQLSFWRRQWLILACITLPSFASAQDGICGNPFVNHFGPFDYRTAAKADRNIVEGRHFTPGIEALVQRSTGSFGSDVSYTLHVFPNHHRALLTMARLAEREGTQTPKGARYSVTCYFERAVQFRPDDTVARGLYAQYLIKAGEKPQAMAQLNAAKGHAGDNALTYFNLGLLYFELQAYDEALEAAHRAQALGLERPELQQSLEKVGKWRSDEPAE